MWWLRFGMVMVVFGCVIAIAMILSIGYCGKLIA